MKYLFGDIVVVEKDLNGTLKREGWVNTSKLKQ